MNYIIDNFEQIMEFAKNYNLPLIKKRAILREYLQTKILEILYREKVSSKLFFIGGTSLRILRGLDRFSEDLDFDLGRMTFGKIDKLINLAHNEFQRENIEVDLYKNQTAKKIYYEWRFKNLLFDLKISQNLSEKLTVKIDLENSWQGEKREVLFTSRYGFSFQAVTITKDQLLIQKLMAYLMREQTQPRDLYDIIWLIGQGAKLDKEFIRKNKIKVDLIARARKKYVKEIKKISGFQKKLRPFLLNEKNSGKILFFEKILNVL